MGAVAKKAAPLLELELLGDEHTLLDAAEALFEHRLEAQRGEGLDDHLWRYHEEEDDGELAFCTHTPMLRQLPLRDPFAGGQGPALSSRRLGPGSELVFTDDEGSPTRVGVVVSAVGPPPAQADRAGFPRVKQGSKKRSREERDAAEEKTPPGA